MAIRETKLYFASVFLEKPRNSNIIDLLCIGQSWLQCSESVGGSPACRNVGMLIDDGDVTGSLHVIKFQ